MELLHYFNIRQQHPTCYTFRLGKQSSIAYSRSSCRKRCEVFGFSNIVPENLLLVNMKPVKNERAVLLQLREVGGKNASFAVESASMKFNKPVVCDVLGNPMNEASLEFKPWENKFIKLSW